MRRIVQALVTALVLVGSASAAWTSAASGTSSARATTMGGGSAPTATAAPLSTTVAVSWPAATYANGSPVAGYIVHRYNAATGAAQTVGASCTGTVQALSCSESGVAIGAWKYSVTPAAGTWRGGESGRSGSVTVPGI